MSMEVDQLCWITYSLLKCCVNLPSHGGLQFFQDKLCGQLEDQTEMVLETALKVKYNAKRMKK